MIWFERNISRNFNNEKTNLCTEIAEMTIHFKLEIWSGQLVGQGPYCGYRPHH